MHLEFLIRLLCLRYMYYIGEGKGSRSRLGPSIDSFRSLGFTPSISVPEVFSGSELLSNSFRLGDAMSLCCFFQEQQQQRQSALLGAGDRALSVPTRHAFCFSSCTFQDQLSTPWRTAAPSFAASRQGSGPLLRPADSRVSIFLRQPWAAIVNGGEFCHRRQHAYCAQVTAVAGSPK